MSKGVWTVVYDRDVRLVFGKTCACVGVPDNQWGTPPDLADGGVPICPECGEDYTYEATELRKWVGRKSK